MSSCVAAVRGAITASANTQEAILAASHRLLTALIETHALDPNRIVSAIFTATADLDADFPAHAARRLGWTDVPLLCTREIDVPGALPRVIRVLLTVSGVPEGKRLAPVYLDGARALRPDLAGSGEERDAECATDAERRTVALIGLGQIGGSIGLALGRDRGWRRVGFDIDAPSRAHAQAIGAIDAAADSLADACRAADLAVLAVPVDALPAAIEAAAAALPRDAALLDTGSARSGITEALARAAEAGIRAVGGHPLAGNERHGLDGADPALFRGARFVLFTPQGAAPDVVLDLVRALGAEPLLSDPGRHDQALARTSHLPYLVASALRELGASAAKQGLSGPAFSDMTRVAGSDSRMARAYCRANAAEIGWAWQDLRARLDAAVRDL